MVIIITSLTEDGVGLRRVGHALADGLGFQPPAQHLGQIGRFAPEAAFGEASDQLVVEVFSNRVDGDVVEIRFFHDSSFPKNHGNPRGHVVGAGYLPSVVGSFYGYVSA